jgi:hypothetical protein
MNKIEYKKVLDTQWALRRAELRAKTEWDSVVKYGKDDLLYELNYEKVKGLREAQKSLNEMVSLLRVNNQLEYSE